MQRCHTYKLQSQNIFKEHWAVGLGGGGVRMDVNEELKVFVKIQKKKNYGGGGGRVGGGGGVRVDVNRDVTFL